MDTTNDTTRTCSRCNEDKPVAGDGWRFSVCPSCAAEIPQTPKLRRCARCRLHTSDFSPRATYCRPCTNAAAREHRARKKERGGPPAPPRLRTCKPCGNTFTCPSEDWKSARNSYCAACTNRIARESRQGKELPPLPDHPPHQVPSRRCRLCGRWKGHTPANFPNRQQPNVCARCQTRRTRANRAKLKGREEYVTCRTCGELKWHEKGGAAWAGNRCPDCSRVAENERYHQRIKTDDAKMEQRRHRQRDAYRAKVGMDASTPETPAIAPVVAPEPSQEDTDYGRREILERVRKRLGEKGVPVLDGRVVVSR